MRNTERMLILLRYHTNFLGNPHVSSMVLFLFLNYHRRYTIENHRFVGFLGSKNLVT
uniref:Uncharacterized protein n=1 Tax=Arundo donax TaxID=35708 RepID=A0A0A9FLD9_ARUDO